MRASREGSYKRPKDSASLSDLKNACFRKGKLGRGGVHYILLSRLVASTCSRDVFPKKKERV